MNNLLAGTKKLLGSRFKDFCDSMVSAFENDGLPVRMQINDLFGVSCQDIGDFCTDFEKETDLEISVCLFVCHECKHIHASIIVDYPEEDTENNYLQ